MGFATGKGGTAQQAPLAAGLRVQTSTQGRPLPIGWGTNRLGGNLIWYGSFGQVDIKSLVGKGGHGSGGKSGKGGQQQQQPNYKVAIAVGLCEGPIVSVNKVWSGSAQFTSPAAVGISGFSTFVGDYAQGPWSYLTTNFPGQDLNYRGIAYMAGSLISLGSVPQLPQYSWEISFSFRFNPGGGIVDANPSDIINDALTNVDYGCNPAIALGSFTQYSNYCVASGLFMSPVLDAQETFASFIQKILDLTNSTCVWSAPGVLNLIPYGDKSVTGNGATYTPALTPQYNLTDDDFIVDQNSPPIQSTRTDPADAVNQMYIECVDRANDYNTAQIEWKDQGMIDRYGLHPESSVVQGRYFTLPAIAALSVQLMGRRKLYIRNTHKFRLPIQYSRLEAGDLVTLTEAQSGMVNQLVRLTVVDYGDADTESIDCEAEELPIGHAAPAAYGSTSSSGAVINYNASPGSVSTPTIFDAPEILTETGFEVWAAVAGTGSDWGGCQVWASTDNATYSQVGTTVGRSRYGVLSGAFALGTDPDTVNICPVDLTTSLGSLTSGTQNDADSNNTLCLVGTELITFQTATLTAANRYNLGAYLRRGVFNTPINAHSPAERFVRLDQGLFKLAYDPANVGKTIYLKFPSFNQYGGAVEDLASVPAYAFVIGGPIGAPDAPTGFAAQQQGAAINFSVNKVTSLYLDRIEIRFADPGELDWNNGVPVCNILRGHTDTNATVPPGTWRFMARAFDRVGNPSKTWAVYDFTVSAEGFTTIVSTLSDPGWLGRQKENLIPWSEDLSQWQLRSTSAVAAQARGFYGGQSLSKVTESASFVSGASPTLITRRNLRRAGSSAGSVFEHGGEWQITNIADNGTLTLAATAAAGTRTWFMLAIRGKDAVTRRAWFDVANGVVGQADAGVTARMSRISTSGGYVCVVTASVNTGSSTPEVRIRMASSNGASAYAGDGVSFMYIGEVQLVTGSVPREYDPTFGTADVGPHGNFLVSVSRALIPDQTTVAGDMVDADLWDTFCKNPQAVCTYQNPEIDKGIDATARVWANIVSTLGPGVSSGTANPQHQIDYRLAAGAYDGFENWTIGNANFRFLKSQFVLTTASGVAKITNFQTVIDKQTRTEGGTYTTPGGGSVAVSYASAFHLTPNVQVTPQGTGDVSASPSSITTTGFTGNFKTAGVAGAGTANWTATGV